MSPQHLRIPAEKYSIRPNYESGKIEVPSFKMMKLIKALALGLLSLILFFSLFVFAITFTVKQTALNPDYAVRVVNDINFSQAIQETINQQVSSGSISPQLQTALTDSLQNMEPVIKQQVSLAIKNAYASLKEQGNAPNLENTLSNSVVNSQFVSDLMAKIDLAQLVDPVVEQQIGTGTGLSQDFQNALVSAINESAPALKQQIVNASGPICQYLTMQTSSLDLQSTLGQTILSNSSVNGILNNLDSTAMTKDILMSYIVGQLPAGIQLSDAQIDQLVMALQPSVKTALTNASGDIAGYLLGTQPDFSITLVLAPALPTLETVAEEAFMTQLPTNLHGLPQAELDDAFAQYYAGFSQTIPATYAVNSRDLGLNGVGGITADITNAQNDLTEARSSIATASQDFNSDLITARTYVGYFNDAFIGLIALLAFVILGIILLRRSVKGSCRILGTVFFLCGALEYAGVLIIKNVGPAQIARLNILPALSNLPGIVLNDFIAPLQLISLVCLIGGILMIGTSILYPRVSPAKNAKSEINLSSKESSFN